MVNKRWRIERAYRKTFFNSSLSLYALRGVLFLAFFPYFWRRRPSSIWKTSKYDKKFLQNKNSTTNIVLAENFRIQPIFCSFFSFLLTFDLFLFLFLDDGIHWRHTHIHIQKKLILIHPKCIILIIIYHQDSYSYSFG